VLVLAVHARAGLIGVLPRRAGQSCFADLFLLGVKLFLALDQQVGHLTRRDLDANILVQVPNLGLTHPASKVQGQGQSFEPWSKLSFIPQRQLGQIGLARRIGPVLLFVKVYVVGAKDDILDHHIFVALEFGIFRQAGFVYLQPLFTMDLDRGFLGAFPARLGLATFLLRRVVGPGWLGFVALDVGFALFAFQPIVLIPQALNLCLCLPQVNAHGFDQVHQPDNQFPSIFILDVAQVYRVQLIQHSCAILLIFAQMASVRLAKSFRGFPPIY